MKNYKNIPLQLKFVTIIVISLLVNACSNKKSEGNISQKSQSDIIKKCVIRISESGPKEKYLVFPIYNNFDFNALFRENKELERYRKDYDYNQKKNQVLHSLNWTDKDFSENQHQINEIYLKKTNPLLLKLSNSEHSNVVYYFSGIHENLIFAHIIYYCNDIHSQELVSQSFNKNQKFLAADSVIFILINGEIQDMILDSAVNLEYQCP